MMVIGTVVTGVWAISFIADILILEYQPPAALHAVMMLVAGGIFGSAVVKKGNGNGG